MACAPARTCLLYTSARLTGKHTFIGRMLDGFASGLWFVGIYVALALRMQHQLMPGTTVPWGAGIWTLALVAGVLCHTTQSSLGDYYRQIHLYFLKGEAVSYTHLQYQIVAGYPMPGIHAEITMNYKF